MDQPGHTAVLPLRPLTTGELLDAAVALLRTRARPLILAGLLLAAAEQALLYPLRAAIVAPHPYLPTEESVGLWWLLIGVGMGTEAVIVALLGVTAGAAALPALLGRQVPRPHRRRGAVVAGATAVAAVAGVACTLGALAGLLPWFAAWGLLGLAVPAVVVDRLGPGRALLRSLSLSLRAGLRPVGVRVLGYLAWLLLRLALGVGGVAVLGLFLTGLDSPGWQLLLASLGWLLVNAVAYPVLACLDAVSHLETRMRVEGLDIALARVADRPAAVAAALAVPR